MKKIIFTSVFGLCILSSMLVYSFAGQRADSAQVITQAMKKKDTTSLVKELINTIKNEVEIDDARYPGLIKEVEAYVATCDNPEEAAILHSLLAEMYLSFEQKNYWQYRRRTPITAFVPEDINEWTINLFEDKVKEHSDLSLQPAALLQQTPIRKFAELLNTGKDEHLRPSLYDYLIYRALEQNPSEELFDKLIEYKRTVNNPESLMLAELDRVAFHEKNQPSNASNKTSIAELDSLLGVYEAYDFAAEIWIARVEMMAKNKYLLGNSAVELATQDILQVCKQAVERYPAYRRIEILKNRIAEVEKAILQTSFPPVVYPGAEISFSVSYGNVRAMTVKIYELGVSPEDIYVAYDSYGNLTAEKTENRKLIRQMSYVLSTTATPQKKDTVLHLSGLEKSGVYLCELSVSDKKVQSDQLVFVSTLAAVPRSLPSGDTEFLVTDFRSGKPVEKATVYLYRQEQNKPIRTDSVLTDENGIAKFGSKEDIRFFRAVSKTDSFNPLTPIYLSRSMSREPNSNLALSLFTDRGLYRPGQTVFVKGLSYSTDKENPHVFPDRKVSVILRDMNHKEVATREFTTNEFGSFNGEFTLPAQVLNGRFTLSAENTTVNFLVEEYKRPGFNVKIEQMKDEVVYGDTVTIKGTAQTFSGVSLQGGVVNYSVIYRPRFISYYFQERQAHFGETTVNSDGTFQFDFVSERDKGIGMNSDYAIYEVLVTLTDSRGETQETNSHFIVGESSLILTTDLKGREIKDSLALNVKARTLNGEPAQTEGRYTIIRLVEEPNQTGDKRKKETGDTLALGHFSTETPLRSVLPGLPSGEYRIKLEAADKKGRPVKAEQDVVLFSDKDKRPPVFSDTWLVDNDLHCLPGESIQFAFGTSHKKAYVLYELFAEGKCVMRKRIELSDEIKKFNIPFQESYGDGVVASFAFIKEGKLHEQHLQIYKKTPNKELTIKTESFRDKLMPGDKESWKLKVLAADSLPAMAEILAGMYDASLDQIAPFEWFFSPTRGAYLLTPMFRGNSSYSTVPKFAYEDIVMQDVPDFDYSRFNWKGALLPGYTSYGNTYSGSALQMRTQAESATVSFDAVAEENVVIGAATPRVTPETGTTKPESSVRRNLSETAFFYPVLRTDKEGYFSLDFTLPESNTSWKLQTLAHTKDLKYGKFTAEIISSKPLMVQPNMPRFLRQGDEVCLRAQVINKSEETLSGRVRLELFDPLTEQPLVCLTKSEQPFSLEGGKQTTVEWTISVPPGKDLAGVRIVADTETVSDGEQQVLPVLSNEVLVMESTPFYMVAAGKKELEVQKQDRPAYRPSLKSFEISSNPIWYAVQALPTLTSPENNSASAWFTSYYSNVLARAIAHANPQIKTRIAQWEAAGENASSLISGLAKNEELKTILLQETPWVMEAANESEQIKRLGLLFDLNRAGSQQAEALQELSRMQHENGAWGWFSGFSADRRITTSILQGMADLVRLNAIEFGQQEKEMQLKALAFLDAKIQEDHAWTVKHKTNKKEIIPSELQLDYLLMRSSYRDIPETKEVREAIRFFTDQAEKAGDKLTLRMKVQTAVLLHRNGKTEEANAIMKWFERTATVSETQGLFWANNRRNGFSPVSPIETHTLLMAACDEMQISGMDVDRMKQWLLNQKRTQHWETTPATLNAIYALLLTGKDWLNEENKMTVQWGEQTTDTSKGTAGIGYSKLTKQAGETTANAPVVIQKEGTTPAWGALYEHYFVPADQVVKQQGNLSIEKKLFVEKVSAKGTQLVALQEGQTLRVGDKAIVRLTIRAKQEMTYVHLKDMRAGCFEPVDQLSGIGQTENTLYYKTAKDASDHFFFDRLPEGTYVLEHPMYVVRSGEYAFGPADIQCLYAPEYLAHTEGGRLIIKD